MKTTNLFTLIAATLIVALTSCNKDEATTASSSSSSLSVKASKSSSISLGESVVFTASDTTASSSSVSSVTWSVSPSSSATITSSGNKASVVFTKSGTYTIQAVNGSVSSSVSVNVGTSAYTSSFTASSSTDQTLSLSGDHINITPIALDSTSYSGVWFSALTTKTYAGGSYLLYTVSTTSSAINIAFTGVCVPSTASSEYAWLSSSSFGMYPLTDGTYTLNITINSKTYTGSLTKSGTTTTITWPDATDITISPLTVAKVS